jgi:gamma-glutamyltranspeptidase/glutathione hydrolase
MDPLDTYDSRRSTAYAPRGVVATSQPLAAAAGVELLRAGGNAFDAAVATAAALNVVEPMSTGLGGDVFALYRTADGEVGALQSQGPAPANVTREELRAAARERTGAAEMPTEGALPVTVPGTARGWERTVEDLGRRSLSAALAPAIRYAREGYPVTEVIASQWSTKPTGDPAVVEEYLPGGSPPEAGDTVTLSSLGETLATIAEEGADAVYEGPIADAIVATVQEHGGFLDHDDLAGFEPRYVDPVSTEYAGAEVYELPPPNQGLLALEALNVADAAGAGEHPLNSVAATHRYVEAMKRAFADGHHYVTDPDFRDVPALADPTYAAERAADIGESAGDVSVGAPPNAEDADTVLLTVADHEGNVVSYINSLFHGFGSGLVAGDTGITLQNRGASFALDDEHPNRFEPGKRPFHTLVPGLARLSADDWLAFGVMGGFMQPQGHLQVLAGLLDGDETLQTALDRPRWRYREDGSLAVEARMDPVLQTKLARRGHDVRVGTPGLFGGGQLARYDRGTLSGATEPRKDGTVATY